MKVANTWENKTQTDINTPFDSCSYSIRTWQLISCSCTSLSPVGLLFWIICLRLFDRNIIDRLICMYLGRRIREAESKEDRRTELKWETSFSFFFCWFLAGPCGTSHLLLFIFHIFYRIQHMHTDWQTHTHMNKHTTPPTLSSPHPLIGMPSLSYLLVSPISYSLSLSSSKMSTSSLPVVERLLFLLMLSLASVMAKRSPLLHSIGSSRMAAENKGRE